MSGSMKPASLKTMSNSNSSGAVLFAKDIHRVATFYQAMLPLAAVVSEQDHIVLESPACQLVIHGIPKHIADTFTIKSPPERREDAAIKLFFLVDSLADARAAAPALGGALNPASAEWEWRGLRICDGHDPEGNVIQFRERIAG